MPSYSQNKNDPNYGKEMSLDELRAESTDLLVRREAFWARYEQGVTVAPERLTLIRKVLAERDDAKIEATSLRSENWAKKSLFWAKMSGIAAVVSAIVAVLTVCVGNKDKTDNKPMVPTADASAH